MNTPRLAASVTAAVLGCSGVLVLAAEKKPPRQWSNEAYYDLVGVEPQKQWEERYDKKNIRFSPEMIRHESGKFLELPEYYPDNNVPMDFEIAKTPPAVDFAIVQGLEPRYLDKARKEGERPIWGGWGEVELGPDGAFYFALGNHIAHGAEAVIVKYDPATKKQSIALSAKKVIGWGDDDWGDGKLHGNPTVGPDGQMWLLTYSSPDPRPEDFNPKFRGSWLLRHDTRTGQTENVGVPLEGQTYPHHVWDPKRGLLVGSNTAGDAILAYDTEARRMIFGGYLPPGIGRFYSHSLFVDPETGAIYGTVMPDGWLYYDRTAMMPHYFVKYERLYNSFTRLKVSVPALTANGGIGALATATRERDAKGRFWCFSSTGALFTFDPAAENVEWFGANWLGGCYTYDLCISPGKRYLYFVPGSDTQAWIYGLPVVQYDITTGKRKVIAFLEPFFRNEYGYSPGGTYGLALDAKGESLFFYVNGIFTEIEKGRSGYGRPAMFHVQIPASERVE
jgi:hypothetical protein